MVLNNMKQRERKNIYRPDMINILMQVRKVGFHRTETEENNQAIDGFTTAADSEVGKVSPKTTWTDDEIIAQCFLFFLAGFDTSSTILSFLATHPDI